MNWRRFTRSRRRRDRCQPIQRSANARPHNQLAFMPWICHGGAAPPGEPPPITLAPLSSRITSCPVLVLYQRMSLIPSPLKSPVPATVQSGVNRAGRCRHQALTARRRRPRGSVLFRSHSYPMVLVPSSRFSGTPTPRTSTAWWPLFLGDAVHANDLSSLFANGAIPPVDNENEQ